MWIIVSIFLLSMTVRLNVQAASRQNSNLECLIIHRWNTQKDAVSLLLAERTEKHPPCKQLSTRLFKRLQSYESHKLLGRLLPNCKRRRLMPIKETETTSEMLKRDQFATHRVD